MLKVLTRFGIKHDRTPAYSHESNGIAEWYNRTIITAPHSMLTGLPLALCAEAVATAVYLRNRLPNRSIGKSTPYESLYNKKPSINHLRPYGTKVFVHLSEEKRQAGTKLMPWAIKGYLIGYTSSDKIYRIYIPSDHKVSETWQIYSTTKTITPLGPNTMEPLITEETYVKVSPPSFSLAPTSTDKPIKQEPEETTIPPTTFPPTTTESSSVVLEQHLPAANPETPNPVSCTPLPSLPEEPDQQQQQHAPAVQPGEVTGPGWKSERISTRQPLSYKRQLGHRGRLATSEIPDEDPTTYRKANGKLTLGTMDLGYER